MTMKKLFLLCTAVLACAVTDVGKAANVSQNEKTVIVIQDSPASLIECMQAINPFEGVVLIVTEDANFSFDEQKTAFTPPLFLAPAPLSVEPRRCYSYAPYKQKGQLKAKFHPAHLFHPLKLC